MHCLVFPVCLPVMPVSRVSQVKSAQLKLSQSQSVLDFCSVCLLLLPTHIFQKSFHKHDKSWNRNNYENGRYSININTTWHYLTFKLVQFGIRNPNPYSMCSGGKVKEGAKHKKKKRRRRRVSLEPSSCAQNKPCIGLIL